MKQASSFIFELRFYPSPRFLDKRGEIAEALADGKLSDWRISQDRIELRSSSNKAMLAIFQYNALAYIDQQAESAESFSEDAKSFCKRAWSFFPSTKISRVGMRSIFITETSNFELSVKKYREKFLKLNDDDFAKFGGDLLDTALPAMDFADGDNFFNVRSGPMEKAQSKTFIDLVDDEKLPDCGTYVDVDFFAKEQSPQTKQKQVFEILDQGIAKAKAINEWMLSTVSTTPQE